MIEVTGKSELSIEATEGEIYKVSYETSTAVDICNDAEGSIFVNSSGTFEKTGSVGNYLVVPEGGSYNGFRPDIQSGTAIYIKANAEGIISIVRKGY